MHWGYSWGWEKGWEIKGSSQGGDNSSSFQSILMHCLFFSIPTTEHRLFGLLTPTRTANPPLNNEIREMSQCLSWIPSSKWASSLKQKHFLVEWSEVTPLCLTLCDPMDCSPPGSSVHGDSQARTLEWAARPSSRGSPQPRDQTQVSYIAGRLFTNWATRKQLTQMANGFHTPMFLSEQRRPFYLSTYPWALMLEGWSCRSVLLFSKRL